MNWQKISLIIGCVVGLIAIGGTCFQVDKYYAHAEEVRGLATKIEFTNRRLEQSILDDSIRRSKNRLWELEIMQEKHPAILSPRERMQIKQLRSDILSLERERNSNQAR